MQRVLCKAKEEKESIMFRLIEDGKDIFKRIPFQNYFYILECDYEDVAYSLNKHLAKTETLIDSKGREFRKLVLNNNLNRNFVRKLLEDELMVRTFEADIASHKRFLIDNPSVPLHQDKLKHAFVDIETYDLMPLKKDWFGNLEATEPILSIALKDQQDNVWYEYNKGMEQKDFNFFISTYQEFVNLRASVEKTEKEVDILHRKQNDGEQINEKELESQEYFLHKLQKEFKNLKLKINQQLPSVKQALIKGEKDLLQKFFNQAKEYNILHAWNGRSFDFPYIQQRMDVHGLNYYDMFIIDIDYMEIYKKNTWDSLKSYSLENVSLHEFESEIEKENSQFENLEQVKKVDWKEKTNYQKYFEMFLLDKSLLEEYNKQDVHLMYLIEQKLHFMRIHEMQSLIAHCFLNETIYNASLSDYFVLNKARIKNLIRPSKPSKEEVERRKDPQKGEFPGGGYTFAYETGLFHKLEGFDFKSKYPTDTITYGISPETFVKSVYPNLSIIFKENEVNFIKQVDELKYKYLNAKGELSKAKYLKAIEELQKSLGVTDSMEQLMWRFIEHYKDDEFTKWLKENNYSSTPADINLDKRGWTIHPHRVFTHESGILPEIEKELIQTRDKVKYSMKQEEKYSATWWEKELYQIAIKISANAFYGFFAFKAGREYMFEIPDAITTSARWGVKKSIIFANKCGYKVTNGDTDSTYIKNLENKYNTKQMEAEYFKYWKEIVKPFNTNCKVLLKNPETGKTEECNHFIVFEHEKTLPACIITAKKRYYFKTKDGEYKTQGGAYKKTDTLKISADLQYELCKDILNGDFDKDKWKQKLLELKDKVFNYQLEEEYIVGVKGISKPLEEYGQPMIDGKTGKQKTTKDGKPRYASVPAHIKVAKQLQEEGTDIEVGDKVSFVVEKAPPIQAISLREFRRQPRYDAKYYWERIIKPIIEIIKPCYPELVYTHFKDCWNYTEKQIERLIQKMNEEEEDEQN